MKKTSILSLTLALVLSMFTGLTEVNAAIIEGQWNIDRYTDSDEAAISFDDTTGVLEIESGAFGPNFGAYVDRNETIARADVTKIIIKGTLNVPEIEYDG